MKKKGVLKMQHISIILRSLLIICLLSSLITEATGSEKPNLVKQTLEAIQNCMVQSPAPWPEEWKQEYLETIRSEIEQHREAAHYAERLELLRVGFTGCWESLTKNKDRALFEVYRYRMRWYVEHLMGTEFPSAEERQRLRDQFTEIWDYATNSLLEQFPFLDPNSVQNVKQDDLRVCYRKIDAPLMPVYLRPMSSQHVDKIKQLWDTRRYARVDLWRRLSSHLPKPDKNSNPISSNLDLHCQLAKESLSQLLGLIWMVVPQRPKYYLDAMENQIEAAKRHLQFRQKATSDQQRLERTRSRQLLQTEHISFLFTVLLESQHPEGFPSTVTQEKKPMEKQEKPGKGGDAYELEKISKKK